MNLQIAVFALGSPCSTALQCLCVLLQQQQHPTASGEAHTSFCMLTLSPSSQLVTARSRDAEITRLQSSTTASCTCMLAVRHIIQSSSDIRAVGPCRISAVPFCSVRLRCSTGSSRQPRTFIRIIQRYELRSLYNSLHRCQRMVYHHPSYRRCLMAKAICS